MTVKDLIEKIKKFDELWLKYPTKKSISGKCRYK